MTAAPLCTKNKRGLCGEQQGTNRITVSYTVGKPCVSTTLFYTTLLLVMDFVPARMRLVRRLRGAMVDTGIHGTANDALCAMEDLGCIDSVIMAVLNNGNVQLVLDSLTTAN
jgi:hypothetical protein